MSDTEATLPEGTLIEAIPSPREWKYTILPQGEPILRLTPEMVQLLVAAFAASAKVWLLRSPELGTVAAYKRALIVEVLAWNAVTLAARERGPQEMGI